MSFNPPIHVLRGPGEIADWPETARITSVEFQQGNFLVRHTKEGTRPDSWPGVVPPTWDGPTQWTLYVVLNADGEWVTAPCIIYWPEATPSLGVHRGSDPAPFSSGSRNWWYQVPGMAGRQPGPGQRIGVICVAGCLREMDVRTVAERSDVAWVTVPANDSGRIDFPAPAPVVVEQLPAPPQQPAEPTQSPQEAIPAAPPTQPVIGGLNVSPTDAKTLTVSLQAIVVGLQGVIAVLKRAR